MRSLRHGSYRPRDQSCTKKQPTCEKFVKCMAPSRKKSPGAQNRQIVARRWTSPVTPSSRSRRVSATQRRTRKRMQLPANSLRKSTRDRHGRTRRGILRECRRTPPPRCRTSRPCCIPWLGSRRNSRARPRSASRPARAAGFSPTWNSAFKPKLAPAADRRCSGYIASPRARSAPRPAPARTPGR